MTRPQRPLMLTCLLTVGLCLSACNEPATVVPNGPPPAGTPDALRSDLANLITTGRTAQAATLLREADVQAVLRADLAADLIQFLAIEPDQPSGVPEFPGLEPGRKEPHFLIRKTSITDGHPALREEAYRFAGQYNIALDAELVKRRVEALANAAAQSAAPPPPARADSFEADLTALIDAKDFAGAIVLLNDASFPSGENPPVLHQLAERHARMTPPRFYAIATPEGIILPTVSQTPYNPQHHWLLPAVDAMNLGPVDRAWPARARRFAEEHNQRVAAEQAGAAEEAAPIPEG